VPVDAVPVDAGSVGAGPAGVGSASAESGTGPGAKPPATVVASPDGLVPTAEVTPAVGTAPVSDPGATGSGGPTPTARSTIGTGRDGRLTILLLGSDKRENTPYAGERTDVMLVASIVPSTRRITLASVSRGSVRWPIAPINRKKWRGATNSGLLKVNSLYEKYYPKFDPNAVMPIHSGALGRVRADVAYGLGVEIDYWAFVRFTGFTALVNHVAGVKVNIPAAINDPIFGSAGGSRGIYFPVASRYKLEGNPPCSPYPFRCRSALVYARSRKGTVGSTRNGGDKRAVRHQQLTVSAISRVIARGADADLVSLLAASNGRIWTSMPRTWPDVLFLFGLLKGSKAASTDRANFFPPVWGVQTTFNGVFGDVMNYTAMRRWCDVHFPAVGG
jgi:anionic cell wall polymer biosynthesis LytR-Cps2A-Psr (LCP) family protein